MRYNPLGHTDLRVSEICLGTMTFGEQNTADEAFAQMDLAIDSGINFFDTAELYAIPPRAETFGATETIIGDWLHARGNRDRIILASKIAGPAPAMPWIRSGQNRPDRKNIIAALEGSLRRLRTDYIDLYQIHWPDRSNNRFGQLGYRVPRQEDSAPTPILETLQVLGDLVQQGKIRHIGISNESPWGMMQWLHLAAQHNLPRIVSIQNPYNLLNRSFEIGLAEIAWQEKCGLLAYSPLARGTLSGKYLKGQRPTGSARAIDNRMSRYSSPECDAATAAYVDWAYSKMIDPCQMAIAFVRQQPFVTATIIGATTFDQLKRNIAAKDVVLDDVIVRGLESIHRRYPNPGP